MTGRLLTGQQSPAPTLPVKIQPDSKGFVGSQVCRTCHADIWQNWFRNAHYKSQVNDKLPSSDRGCEGCHGPAKDHVEARGDKTKITAFSLLKPRAALDACLRCHSQQFGRMNIRRSPHTLNDVVCNTCHKIHKSETPKFLLAGKQIDFCGDCHQPVRAQFALPFKHRVNEGFMQCSDCHNPHGTQAPTWRMGARPRLVDQALGNEEACLKCHTDKRGPFAFEHAAVRVDGCEACHQPHGSMNARLLHRPVVFTLCLECHNGAGNFGSQGDGVLTHSPSHNMADPKYQNCTTCHVRIHGSNADPLFRR
ncbi:MAG: DmsE family decaheme c-type cytochrome [Bryobacter sp.]|nr:DmsE family decaheme c-type cytochrome [Bryobacter sp.]